MGSSSTHPPNPAPSVETVYREHGDFLRRVLRRYRVRPEDEGDVLQHVLRAVQRGLPRLEPERRVGDRLLRWLHEVARRWAMNYHRTARRLRDREARAHRLEVPMRARSPEECARDNEARRQVRALVSRIEPRRRAVLELVHFDGMTTKEASRALSIAEGTAKTRLLLAHRDLRQMWERHEQQQRERGIAVLPVDPLSLFERARERSGEATFAPATTWWTRPLSALPRAMPIVAAKVAPKLISGGIGAGVGGAIVFALLSPAAAPASTSAMAIPTAERQPAVAAFVRDSPPAGVSPSGTEAGSTSAGVASVVDPASSVAVCSAPSSPLGRAVAAPATTSAPTASRTDEAVALEQAILRAAQVAIDRGDAAGGRRRLEEHARRFPRGRFGVTRELVWIRVLLHDGKRSEANARAAALRRSLPSGSPPLRALDALIAP